MREKITNAEPIIYKELKNGNSIKNACKAAGLPRSTFYYWEQQAKNNNNVPNEAVSFYANIRSDNGYGPIDFSIFRKIEASIDEALAEAKEILRSVANILEGRDNGYR